MKERRKLEYPEKTPGNKLQKMPENSSLNQDLNPHSSTGGRLGKQTITPFVTFVSKEDLSCDLEETV